MYINQVRVSSLKRMQRSHFLHIFGTASQQACKIWVVSLRTCSFALLDVQCRHDVSDQDLMDFCWPLRGLVCFMYFTGVFFRSSDIYQVAFVCFFSVQKAYKNVDENVVKFRLGVTVISVMFNHHVNRET